MIDFRFGNTGKSYAVIPYFVLCFDIFKSAIKISATIGFINYRCDFSFTKWRQ